MTFVTAARERLTKRALKLLSSPYFFDEYYDLLERLGLVGERANAARLFVVGVSRLWRRPLNAFVKGRSSSGKNHLVKSVLRVFPIDAICELTSTSPRAFDYSGDEFRNKIVYVQELNEKSGTVHPTRLLISENKLVRKIAVREGKRIVTKEYVAKGPVATVSTTTKDQLRIDDETRNISIWVDESIEQTRRIVEASFAGTGSISKEELKVWHEIQRILQERAGLPVCRPAWFVKLAKDIDSDDTRARRYVPAFITACETIALIRSFQKEKNETVEKNLRIAIDFADVAAAILLFEPVFAQSLHRGSDETMTTRAIVVDISLAKHGRPVSAAHLAKHLKIGRDHAYAQLRDALEAGTIRRANKSTKGNTKLYLPAQQKRFLPDPEEFFNKVPELGDSVRFVSPVSCEWVHQVRKPEKNARTKK